MTARIYAITGAFGVLGSAVARAPAGRGARVALIHFRQAPPPGLPAGPDVLVLGGVDLTDAIQAGAAIEAAAERFGGLDALLNIAGGFAWETHEAGDWQTWHRLFLINAQTAANAS